MKQQVDRGRREVEEWKKGDKVMLSTKNLVLKKLIMTAYLNENLPSYKCQSDSII